MHSTRIRAGLAALAIALAVPLAGCAPTATESQPSAEAPTSEAPETDAAETEAATEEAESATSGPTVVPSEPGDCAFDPDAPGAVVLTVTSDDATTPIEVTYSAFREGAEPEVRTVTVTGPVVVAMQTDCGTPTATPPWTFTATSATENSLGCTSFFGGKVLVTDSDYAEGDAATGASVDCSGHPGI